MSRNQLENIRKLKDAVLMKDTLEGVCESTGSSLKSTVIIAASGGEILASNEKDCHNIIIRIERTNDDIICVESNLLKNLMLKIQENITIVSDKNKKRTYVATCMPLSVTNEKIGLSAAYRIAGHYSQDEIILLEYAAIFAAQKINASKIMKQYEHLRKIDSVKSAIETLSASELKAAKYVLKELQGGEGLVVASKIADNAGITRSVTVNALRKIESAGAIESRSLGMKGTYIKVVNDSLIDCLTNNYQLS